MRASACLLMATRTSGDVRFPAAGEAACVDLNQIDPYPAEHSLRPENKCRLVMIL
jgi:hypothetical protein